MNVFMMASTTATAIAEKKLLTLTPGRIYEVIRTANVVSKRFMRGCIKRHFFKFALVLFLFAHRAFQYAS